MSNSRQLPRSSGLPTAQRTPYLRSVDLPMMNSAHHATSYNSNNLNTLATTFEYKDYDVVSVPVPGAPYISPVDLPSSGHTSVSASWFSHGLATPPSSPEALRIRSHGINPVSSFNHNGLGLGLTIHPLLLSPSPYTPRSGPPSQSPTRSSLLWSILDPPLTSIRLAPPHTLHTLSQPALSPPLSQLHLTVQIIAQIQAQSFPWSIHIQSTNGMNGITITDLLTQIHASLTRPVNEIELARFNPSQLEVARFARASRARCAGPSAFGGLVRADFLGNCTLFAGLVVMQDGSLAMQLSAATGR